MLAAVHPAIIRSDYEAMPQGPPYFQLIEGRLVMSPSPLTNHQRVVMRLSSVLHHHVQQHQLGEVFVAPLDVFLNDINIYQPDIVYLSKSRLHRLTEQGVEGAPDLCVEVLSPSTERFDRVTKKKIFAQSGVTELWLIDPKAETLSIHSLAAPTEDPAQLFTASETLHPSLFPGLTIDLRQIFARA